MLPRFYKSSRPDISKIRKIANAVRNEFRCDEEGSGGLCADASERIVTELGIVGIKSRLIEGSFILDKPKNAISNIACHCWVEVLTRPLIVVDVTADQFNHELKRERMKKIIIGPYKRISKRFKKR